jgi:hypothetical protein
VTQGLITVNVGFDGDEIEIEVPSGSTVEDTLAIADISLESLDRTEPPIYTLLSDGSQITIIRVQEEFNVEQVVISYEQQEVRNESLPAGETRLSQPGVNGLQEVTYRRVYENDTEVSNSIVKSVIVNESIPEIIMVGSQTPFASLPISGRLAYLSSGNAWVMEGTTGNRRPVVTTGDLDGHIFSLSPDGSWLLFTRKAEGDGEINTLWAASLDDDPSILLDLDAKNIIHFADWNPALSVIAYSTVEPRSTAPGWQANNDLIITGVSSSGFVSPPRVELEPNSGGVYGWWGMDFAWSPDGSVLAYTRPDGIGIFDPKEDTLTSLLDIIPLQTGSDWAWVPGISWGPDGNVLYMVDHVSPPGLTNSEESPHFDLLTFPLGGGAPVHIQSDVGMFGYPVPSPIIQLDNELAEDGNGTTSENAFMIAYLQAVFPLQSDGSQYRLVVIDRDGSNRKVLFPSEGSPGLDPQIVSWSPEPVNNQDYMISVIFQNNLWLVNTSDGLAQQVTGDGLTTRIDWK